MTTLMALRYGPSDPGISVPVQLIANWFAVLQQDPRRRRRVQRTWERKVARIEALPANRRWAQAGGQMCAAVICTLLDLGWKPTTAWA